MNPNPEPPTGGPQARILIVDDERTNRELLELMLAPEGFLLETASSGEEALTMVAHRPPDLILLDLMMADMDGYRVTKQIKRNPATKDIAIVILTAHYDRRAKMLALSAGAEDFLTKPVGRSELCMRVRNLLHHKAGGDFHHQFDAAPVGIVHTSLDGQWLRVNQRLCDLLGYSRNELLSGTVQELMQLEEEELVGEAESFRRMASGTQDRHVVDEKRYRRRDGSFVWARLNMSIHRDAEGRSQHFISVIEDITTVRPPAAA